MSDEVPHFRGLLVIGCGYSGQAIARLAAARGVPVWGTSRGEDRFDAIRAAGATPLAWSAGQPLDAALIARIDAVVDCAGPPWSGEPDPTGAILDAIGDTPLRAFAYLSSTTVYGDHGGDWVDETTPCEPRSAAGRRRLDAEQTLLRAFEARGLPVRICRLPGIYGPGRSMLDRVRDGRFRVVRGHVSYSNRIHVEDLAQGVWAAMTRGQSGRLYLITDGNPAPLDEIGAFAASLLGLPAPEPKDPEEVRASAHPNAWSMLTESKRLSNRRMLEELGVALRFPSYQEGLTALRAAEAAAERAGAGAGS